MSQNTVKNIYDLESPIHAVLVHKLRIIISLGNNKKQADVNRLVVYDRANTLTKIYQSINTENLLFINLQSCHKTDLIVGAAGPFMSIYYIANTDKSEGNLSLLHSEKIDTHPQNPCLNSVKFNYYGNYLAAGGNDGILRVWEVNFAAESMKLSLTLCRTFKEHTDIINCVDFHLFQPFVCSSSKDGTCQIFKIDQTAEEYKKIIRPQLPKNPTQKLNVVQCFFTMDEKFVVTGQNFDKGPSYISKWDHENDYKEILTTKFHNAPITCGCMSREGLFLGFGTEDGFSKTLNLRFFEVENYQRAHLSNVLSVSFIEDARALLSGSQDNTYNFLYNLRKVGRWNSIAKVWVVASVLIWFSIFVWKNIISTILDGFANRDLQRKNKQLLISNII